MDVTDISSIPNGYYWLYHNYDKEGGLTEFVEVENGWIRRLGADDGYFGDDFEYFKKQGKTVKMEKVEIPPPSWAK